MPRTITVELDDETDMAVNYLAHEIAGGDEAEAVRQAIDAHFVTVRIANYRAKEARIAAQPDAEHLGRRRPGQ